MKESSHSTEDRRRMMIRVGGALLIGLAGSAANEIEPAQAKGGGFVMRGFDRVDTIPDKLGFSSNTKIKSSPLDNESLLRLKNDIGEQMEILKAIREEAGR